MSGKTNFFIRLDKRFKEDYDLLERLQNLFWPLSIGATGRLLAEPCSIPSPPNTLYMLYSLSHTYALEQYGGFARIEEKCARQIIPEDSDGVIPAALNVTVRVDEEHLEGLENKIYAAMNGSEMPEHPLMN